MNGWQLSSDYELLNLDTQKVLTSGLLDNKIVDKRTVGSLVKVEFKDLQPGKYQLTFRNISGFLSYIDRCPGNFSKSMSSNHTDIFLCVCVSHLNNIAIFFKVKGSTRPYLCLLKSLFNVTGCKGSSWREILQAQLLTHPDQPMQHWRVRAKHIK